MSRFCRHHYYGLGVCGVLAVFLAALLIQYVDQLQPCHLCIFQRFILVIIFLLLITGWVLKHVDNGVLLWVGLLAAIGSGSCVYHLYLQLNPPKFASCDLGAWAIFKQLSITQWLGFIFEGQGDCAKVVWRFLGLSTPMWLAVFYVFFWVYWYHFYCYVVRQAR